MRTVLVITGHYAPMYRDGGPVRTLVNLSEYLGDEYCFKILCADREKGEDNPHEGIVHNKWTKVGKAEVMYLPPKGFTFSTIKKHAKSADVVYVTGCYREYVRKTLVLKKMRMIHAPVFLASMGMFSPKALELKSIKKRLYISLMRFSGLFGVANWSVTSPIEEEYCRKTVKPRSGHIFIAEDLPRLIDDYQIERRLKPEKQLNLCYLSRISQEKNLLYAIEALKQTKSRINFSIYGPIFDEEYWNRCKAELEKMPEGISWEYKGAVETEEVVKTFSVNDVMILPTIGENYGHVIFEALLAGCICIISDQTPWSEIDGYGVGKAIPLLNQKHFSMAIDDYAQMNGEEFNKLSLKAHQFALRKSNEARKNTGYRAILDYQ